MWPTYEIKVRAIDYRGYFIHDIKSINKFQLRILWYR